MRKRWLMYVAAASGLALLSPLVASLLNVIDLQEPGLVEWWLVLAPIQVEVMLQAEPQQRTLIWMIVYFFESLALVSAMGWIAMRFSQRSSPDSTAHANPKAVG